MHISSSTTLVVVAMMAAVVAAMMTAAVVIVMMMVGEPCATKVNARSAAVIIAWSAVIVVGRRFIAGSAPAIAIPCSLTYQSHLFGLLICNRCAQSASSRYRVCPRADERSCASECRHSRSCKNQTTHFFLLLNRSLYLARLFGISV